MKKIRFPLPLVILLILGPMITLAQSQGEHQPAAEQTLIPAALDLADIVPLAAKLTGRLAELKKTIQTGLDTAAVEKQYLDIEARLQAIDGQMEQLGESPYYKYRKLVALKRSVNQEIELCQTIGLPIAQTIRELEKSRKAWLAQQTQWHEWESVVHEEGEFERLEATFDKAGNTIQTALDLVLSRLDVLLAVQERGSNLQEELNTLPVKLNMLIEAERRSTFIGASPPLLSAQFLAALKSGEIWSAAMHATTDITWPDLRFFARYGWIVLLNIVVSCFVIIGIYRNRPLLDHSVRWKALAARPLSAGLFVGIMSTVLIYEYLDGIPDTWKLAYSIAAAIAFTRLMGRLTETSWKKRLIIGLIIATIATRLMDVLGFPIPLIRLFTALVSLVGLLFCWRSASASARNQGSRLYGWILRWGSLFFAVVIVAELWGETALASYLFVSFIRSLTTVLVFVLAMFMIRGALEWLFKNTPLRQTSVMYGDDTENIIDRLARLIDIAIVGLVLAPGLLMIWGVYDSLTEATRAVLSLGFNLGSQKINVSLLLVSTSILYSCFLASWIFQKLLVDEVIFKRRFEKGVRISIGRLFHYTLIVTGFLFAISTLGFEISQITILLSALGVGIGFGLQGIVNNFVSGLILLFERPVRVGDTIEIGGKFSEIKNIGIRATTVQTRDLADRIIPNADLISNEVTNWTLTNRQIRLIIPVGVAYGSDVDLVTETLMNCAKTNPKVAKRPEPKVRFLNFGESTLDFELRVFISDFDLRIEVRDTLNRQIDRCFRDANIEIAFPQRDVHLRRGAPTTEVKPSDA